MSAATVHKLSDRRLAALADRFGELDSLIKAQQEQLASLRADLLRLGVDRLEGKRYRVTVTTAAAKRLDVTAIRKAMPEKWQRKFTVETVTQTVRCTVRKASLID